MIQRIQTVFLFLVAVAMILVIVFPIWHQVNPGQTEMMTLTAWKLETVDTATNDVLELGNKASCWHIGDIDSWLGDFLPAAVPQPDQADVFEHDQFPADGGQYRRHHLHQPYCQCRVQPHCQRRFCHGLLGDLRGHDLQPFGQPLYPQGRDARAVGG
jgi:hypothetical protein